MSRYTPGNPPPGPYARFLADELRRIDNAIETVAERALTGFVAKAYGQLRRTDSLGVGLIPATAYQTVLFNSLLAPSYGVSYVGANEFSMDRPGVYFFAAQVVITHNTTQGVRVINLAVRNGGTILFRERHIAGQGADTTVMGFGLLIRIDDDQVDLPLNLAIGGGQVDFTNVVLESANFSVMSASELIPGE